MVKNEKRKLIGVKKDPEQFLLKTGKEKSHGEQELLLQTARGIKN